VSNASVSFTSSGPPETAQAVAAHHRLDVRPLPGVIEADYGGWTGRPLSELATTDLWKVVQRTPSRAAFPDGEGLAAMQARVVAALDQVVADHAGALLVVVSHADPIKAAIAHYTGIHLDLFQRIAVSPASVSVFEFDAHGVTMLKCNDTGSLDELRGTPPETSPAPAALEPSSDPSLEPGLEPVARQ
jgi:probable phosphoglycerate mutase